MRYNGTFTIVENRKGRAIFRGDKLYNILKSILNICKEPNTLDDLFTKLNLQQNDAIIKILDVLIDKKVLISEKKPTPILYDMLHLRDEELKLIEFLRYFWVFPEEAYLSRRDTQVDIDIYLNECDIDRLSISLKQMGLNNTRIKRSSTEQLRVIFSDVSNKTFIKHLEINSYGILICDEKSQKQDLVENNSSPIEKNLLIALFVYYIFQSVYIDNNLSDISIYSIDGYISQKHLKVYRR